MEMSTSHRRALERARDQIRNAAANAGPILLTHGALGTAGDWTEKDAAAWIQAAAGLASTIDQLMDDWAEIGGLAPLPDTDLDD
jgi:hypothetical protein